jgi:hypothetical protein
VSTKPGSIGLIGNVKSDVERAGKKAATSPVVEAFTRLGYGVRGLIYLVMGLLALNVVLGKGGSPASQQGAIAAIGRQPAGMFLLWVILIGLVSYSLWGLIRAIFDPLHKGHDLKGLIARGGFISSAFSYAILIPFTYGYINGAGQAGGGQTQQSLAKIMAMPWGRWAVGLFGVVVIIAGFNQIFAGFRNSFDKQIKTYALTAREMRIATQMGRFGTATRGFVLAIVGVLMALAAYRANPSQGIGVDSALSTIMRQPYGVWLLGIVALGLITFGIYSMLSAAWYRSRR